MTPARAVGVGLLGLAVTAGAIALVFMSEHEDDPWTTVLLAGSVGLGFIGAGLIAWLSRPSNRTGALMTLVGFSWFLGALGESNEPVVHGLGMALDGVVLLFFAWLMLAFPTGRLEGRSRKALVGGVAVLVGPLQLALVLFADHSKHLGCTDCPANGLHIGAPDPVGEALAVSWQAVAAVLVVTFAVDLVLSWRRGSPAYRRAVAPVFLAGGAVVATLGVSLADELAGGHGEAVIGPLSLVTLLTVPVAMLIGLLRSGLAHRGVGRLLRELPAQPTADDIVDAVRRALRDPTLEIAFWSSESGYVDAGGRAFELPAEGSGRVATTIDYEGRHVAAFVHDPSLLEEPELLESVVAAARLGLEKDRLQAELRARLEDLQRERDFIRTVVNTAPSFFCVLDPEGRIVRFNDTLANVSGIVDDDRARGRPFWDVFATPPDRGRAQTAVTDSAQPSELRMPSVEGAERLVAWTVTPVEDAERNPRLLLCGLDVTERRRQEEELRASRARIVEAGDAERRRLERNLHDGAQQRLVSLSLALRLARSKVESDPARAGEILAAASEELSHALDELRELARGIHPAVLTDRGLAAALDSLAARSPVPVAIDGVGERFPQAVEAAAYYVVSEALANVAKYAEAEAVTVRVEHVDGRAVVEVVDDGIGGADPSRGSGLRGLADRVEALDGRLEVESANGAGTRIRAEIPLR